MRKERWFRHYKKEIKRFFRRFKYPVMIATAAAAVLVIVFAVLPQSGGEAEETPVPQQGQPGDIYEGVDEETLAGLAGTDTSLLEQQEERRMAIGVTLLSVRSGDEVLLAGLEQAAAADREQGVLEDLMVYDARGGPNQQIQDVYAMLNKGVSVLVVANTEPYNFSKIAEIAGQSGVQVVACDIDAQSGFAVNVQSKDDIAAAFSQFLKGAGMQSTEVLGADAAQIETMKQTLEVGASYDEMWDAIYAIGVAIGDGQPIQSMAVFDYNSNDVLRAWLKADVAPRAFAGVATVRFIKTWYGLLNGGVEVVTQEATEEAEAVTKTVSMTPADITCYAATTAENTGGAVYAFAKNLMQGKTLPQQDYVYTLPGAEAITADNLKAYYDKIKEQDSGLVYSMVDISGIDALFTGAAAA